MNQALIHLRHPGDVGPGGDIHLFELPGRDDPADAGSLETEIGQPTTAVLDDDHVLHAGRLRCQIEQRRGVDHRDDAAVVPHNSTHHPRRQGNLGEAAGFQNLVNARHIQRERCALERRGLALQLDDALAASTRICSSAPRWRALTAQLKAGHDRFELLREVRQLDSS